MPPLTHKQLMGDIHKRELRAIRTRSRRLRNQWVQPWKDKLAELTQYSAAQRAALAHCKVEAEASTEQVKLLRRDIDIGAYELLQTDRAWDDYVHSSVLQASQNAASAARREYDTFHYWEAQTLRVIAEKKELQQLCSRLSTDVVRVIAEKKELQQQVGRLRRGRRGLAAAAEEGGAVAKN